tara:strand:+ start:6375 stop:6743 length:369 start_codon:yes stop_codon:yes gene_type:complete
MSTLHKNVDYKKLSKQISDSHKESGISITPIYGTIDYLHFINLSDDETIFTSEGSELSPKKIRKFLWEHKKDRKFQRKNAVIWTSYDEEEDISYLGVGASSNPKVSTRTETHVLWEKVATNQ